MTKNGFVTRIVLAVVHQLVASAHTPKRSRAHFVLHGLVKLTSIGIDYLSNTVARAHIMQQKITIRMNDLVAECIGDRERSAIDERTRRGAGNACYVTDVTTYCVERRRA